MDNDKEKRDPDEFKLVRKEVGFQHQQLSSRVGAYLASQSFLITAMIASSRSDASQKDLKLVSLGAIPFIGMCISVWILWAIRGAWDRIQKQREVMDMYPSIRARLIPQDPKNRAHKGGVFYAFAVPSAFI